MDKSLERIRKLKMNEEIRVSDKFFDNRTVMRVPGGLIYKNKSIGGLFSADEINTTFVPFDDFEN